MSHSPGIGQDPPSGPIPPFRRRAHSVPDIRTPSAAMRGISRRATGKTESLGTRVRLPSADSDIGSVGVHTGITDRTDAAAKRNIKATITEKKDAPDGKDRGRMSSYVVEWNGKKYRINVTKPKGTERRRVAYTKAEWQLIANKTVQVWNNIKIQIKAFDPTTGEYDIDNIRWKNHAFSDEKDRYVDLKAIGSVSKELQNIFKHRVKGRYLKPKATPSDSSSSKPVDPSITSPPAPPEEQKPWWRRWYDTAKGWINKKPPAQT